MYQSRTSNTKIRDYPSGIELIVPGYNDSELFEVLDSVYDISGNQLDVFFDSH
jgi:3D (Asp-Asp-Asp) domain-containing protein